MRVNIFLLSFLLLLITCTGKDARQREMNPSYKHLLTLLEQGDYFRLESALNSYKDRISKEQRLYVGSFLSNAFNRNEEAIKMIDTLLTDLNPSDSMRAGLLILQSDCFFKTFQYAKDAGVCNLLLDHFAQYADSSEIAEMKNHILLCKALKDIPPQQTRLPENTVVKWTKNKMDLMEIPVTRRGITYSGLFDTRANISCVTKTYAGKLKLKILASSYEESSGITGIKFKAEIGFADSISIGGIVVKNVVFEVLPDSILYIAPLKLSIDIIIGYPVIAQMGEIHIRQDGSMIIPGRQTEKNLHNLALNKLDPVLFLKTGKDTLCFHFDFGATSTQLYATYYERYRSEIESGGKRKTILTGGAGGIQSKEVYRIPSFRLDLGNNGIVIDSVDVFMEKIFPDEKYYGNLGQDFISKYSEIILNFGYMYIDAN